MCVVVVVVVVVGFLLLLLFFCCLISAEMAGKFCNNTYTHSLIG